MKKNKRTVNNIKNMGRQKGFKHSKKTREKISIANKGKISRAKGFKHSKKTREKISIANKGISRNKNISRSEETKKKISKATLGRKFSEETRKKIGKANSISQKGKKLSKETRKKISESMKGSNAPNWKDGITPINHKIRGSIEYRLWREAVFARDNWTCQKTGIKGGELQAHHIQNFSDFSELRTSIENGVTLSKKVHMKFHKKYGKKNNTKKQLEEFLEEQEKS